MKQSVLHHKKPVITGGFYHHFSSLQTFLFVGMIDKVYLVSLPCQFQGIVMLRHQHLAPTLIGNDEYRLVFKEHLYNFTQIQKAAVMIGKAQFFNGGIRRNYAGTFSLPNNHLRGLRYSSSSKMDRLKSYSECGTEGDFI